jgi:hypothetical protein
MDDQETKQLLAAIEPRVSRVLEDIGVPCAVHLIQKAKCVVGAKDIQRWELVFGLCLGSHVELHEWPPRDYGILIVTVSQSADPLLQLELTIPPEGESTGASLMAVNDDDRVLTAILRTATERCELMCEHFPKNVESERFREIRQDLKRRMEAKHAEATR